MPTTHQEAGKVLEICLRHKLTSRQMYDIFHDLHYEVGEVSDNSSVKETMNMLFNGVKASGLCKQPAPEPAPPRAAVSSWVLPTIVTIHMIYVFAAGIAAIEVLFLEPWYVSLFVISFLVFLASRAGQCLFTVLENRVRVKLGLPEIDSFIYHYFGVAFRWLANWWTTGMPLPE